MSEPTTSCRAAILAAFFDLGDVLTAEQIIERVDRRFPARPWSAEAIRAELQAMASGDDPAVVAPAAGAYKPAKQPPIPPADPVTDVLYEAAEGVACITLNRPVVLNALGWSIRRGLMAALVRARDDDAVRAVILTGIGRGFCAGGDFLTPPPTDDLPSPGGFEICMTIWSMPKPVIAAVNGFALGQGCELAGICDLTIAAEDAHLGEIQIRHGFAPPVLITPYLLGPKQAKEALLLGEMYDAHEAQRLGMVNRVVPHDRLLDEAERMARKLVALPAHRVRANKALVNRVHELAGFHAALDYRGDPAIAALSESGGDALNEHLRVLREQGWEAFRASRDRNYQQ